MQRTVAARAAVAHFGGEKAARLLARGGVQMRACGVEVGSSPEAGARHGGQWLAVVGAVAAARARRGDERGEEDVDIEDDKTQEFVLHIIRPCGATSRIWS